MRKGYFEISDEMYTKDWDILSQIFKDFRPIHIEFNHWNRNIWVIVGVSDKFDEVEEDEPIPQYEVIFTRHPYDQYTYVFKRV
jgi:hypothetical protein